jgi:UDPglucose 6-dehydrogenase
MSICIIGTGYVGLVTGACFAEMGNTVVCFDKDLEKIQALSNGRIPIYEPGLEEIVARNLQEGRLSFTSSLDTTMTASDMFFIAVGTPPNGDGSADLNQVREVARSLASRLSRYSLIVTKSTVPVGTADHVEAVICETLKDSGSEVAFDVVSNPEFLKEGSAVDDFMRPERIIIGTDSPKAIERLRNLYAAFTRSHERILVMSRRDAEMTKYVANTMLAAKISLMNEVANLCELMGVDVENVRLGIGSDSRIGFSFIYAGCGYGGSCFPKDVKALIHTAESVQYEPVVMRAIDARNESQKRRLFDKIAARFGADLSGKSVAVWGLAFKPGTDDMREAPSIVLLRELVASGARVRAHDPVAVTSAERVFPREWLADGRVELVSHQYDAVKDADAMVLVTEWKPYRQPDLALMKRLMRTPVIFDGRNQYSPSHLRAEGFEYFGIGRAASGSRDTPAAGAASSSGGTTRERAA